jgi:hypothetical protein
MRRHARTRTAAWVVTALSFAVTVLVAIPASAATPTLTASLTPSTIGAGAGPPAPGQPTFVLTVSSDQGVLNRLSLQAPGGFFVGDVTSSSGNPSASGNQITVTGLKVSGSEVLTVSVDAWAACTPSGPPSYTWGLTAFQKGGTAYADRSFPTTVTSTSSCRLEFEPIADQIKNATPPASSPNVTVAVSRANGTTDTSYSGADVSLSIQVDPGNPGAVLTGGGPKAPVNGLAKFSTSLNQSGYGYVLEACSPTVNGGTCALVGEESDLFFSDPFAVYDAAFTCTNNPNVPCTVSAPGTQVSVKVTAPGQINKIIKAGVWDVPPDGPIDVADLANVDCADYDEVTSQVAAFAYTGTGQKIVVDTISADIMKTLPQNGVSHLQTCLASSVFFTDRFGADAVKDPTLDLYVGLLPDCPNVSPIPTLSVPCVISRTGGGQGTGQITYIADDGDPGGARH